MTTRITSPVLTLERANQITDLIYAAIETRAILERMLAEETRADELGDWITRVDAASTVERDARSAAIQAVRDLAWTQSPSGSIKSDERNRS